MHVCKPAADCNIWIWMFPLVAMETSGVFPTYCKDRSAQTRQVHINSHAYMLHTPSNPTYSGWSDHEWLKADYKPDSPPHPNYCNHNIHKSEACFIYWRIRNAPMFILQHTLKAIKDRISKQNYSLLNIFFCNMLAAYNVNFAISEINLKKERKEKQDWHFMLWKKDKI